MFRMFFGNKYATCKAVKHPSGSKREEISDFTLKTLGSGDVIGAVRLPPDEELEEWIAANTIDFFQEVQLIWDIICDAGVGTYEPGKGFPPGFEYRWADSKARTPIVCTGPEYVAHVMRWIESEVNNTKLFPVSPTIPFPKNFVQSVKVIYTRIFRVYAIVYSNHFSKLEDMGAASHLNTSFKHFLYFVWEFDLLQNSELEALREIISEIRSRYIAAGGRRK